MRESVSSENIHKTLTRLSAVEAAARLLGSDILRQVEGRMLSGRIVEVEAYDQSDPASHSFRGVTKRNSVMFGPAGFAYVYFTYGMHHCFNVVIGPKGTGAAVLIRALEPIEGKLLMLTNRKSQVQRNLLNGPARLTQALNIDYSLNGHDLSIDPLRLKLNPPLSDKDIKWGERIGIKEDRGNVKYWRAVISGSKYLSRPL
jgi:DNA-3-methyladenine glycosylase